MGDPQVILIGGAPGAGKTTLGRALASRLAYTMLTADDLARAIDAPGLSPGHWGLIHQPGGLEAVSEGSEPTSH